MDGNKMFWLKKKLKKKSEQLMLAPEINVMEEMIGARVKEPQEIVENWKYNRCDIYLSRKKKWENIIGRLWLALGKSEQRKTDGARAYVWLEKDENCWEN